MKETWDYNKFVRCYNVLAQAHAGNDYDQRLEPEELKQNYELGTAMTIAQFAEGCYQLDQEY